MLASFQCDLNPNLRFYHPSWAKLISLPRSRTAFKTSKTRTSFRSGKKFIRRLADVASGTEERSNTDKVTSSHVLNILSPRAQVGRVPQALRQRRSRQGNGATGRTTSTTGSALLLLGAKTSFMDCPQMCDTYRSECK